MQNLSIPSRLSASAYDPDAQFFTDHPDRQAHIRVPVKMIEKNKQRAVRYGDECEAEFRTLGDHAKDRRRIILWRVPKDNPFYNPRQPQILKIPFLLFADETVEDTDAILLPIVHEIMVNASN
jgi:hypothetical protein